MQLFNFFDIQTHTHTHTRVKEVVTQKYTTNSTQKQYMQLNSKITLSIYFINSLSQNIIQLKLLNIHFHIISI